MPHTLRITDGEVLLTVEDTGPGLSTASSRGTGMGMGLELCGALVRRSEGSLDVVRDGPEGTTFVLRIPVERKEG
jgi:signal transduction histidine kinase